MILFRGQVFEAEIVALARRRAWELLVARDEQTLLREVPRATALWITPTFYSAAVTKRVAEKRGVLRWIGLTSAGYDVLLSAGKAPGVDTTYAVGVHGPATAEHAVALLLATVRALPLALENQRTATWDRNLAAQLRSLEDMTVAIVGFGSIGHEIARKLRPLAGRIVGVNRSGGHDPDADALLPVSRLHDVLTESDAVVVSVAMSEETRHLIDEAAFAAMRPGTVFVNVARGPVVDSAALKAAIGRGRVRGVALDVTDPEPLPAGDPLWRAPWTTITPHVGSFGSKATGGRLALHFERNYDRVLADEPLEGLVP